MFESLSMSSSELVNGSNLHTCLRGGGERDELDWSQKHTPRQREREGGCKGQRGEGESPGAGVLGVGRVETGQVHVSRSHLSMQSL